MSKKFTLVHKNQDVGHVIIESKFKINKEVL